VLSVVILLGSVGGFLAGSVIGFLHARVLLDPSFPTAGSVLILVVLLTAALDAARLEAARIAGELGAAHKIQLGMVPLPGAIKGLPDTLDFHALLEPAEAVGGDLYDAFMLDAHRFCFVIGDVTGKGVPAALFMALSKTLYKSAALRAHMSMHELMMSVNTEIARENPADLFVTLLAGLLDTRTGTLELCRAGHPEPILLRRAAVPCVLDTPGGPPLCVLPDFPYVTDHMQLQAEDVLVMVTDGVTEAQNTRQTFYGQERTVAFLHALQQGETGVLSAAAVCQGLYNNVLHFMHGAPASDDITIVVIRYIGPVPPVLTLL
jgi:serine phosphatase RsbU (regulator of sigma subunit)